MGTTQPGGPPKLPAFGHLWGGISLQQVLRSLRSSSHPLESTRPPCRAQAQEELPSLPHPAAEGRWGDQPTSSFPPTTSLRPRNPRPVWPALGERKKLGIKSEAEVNRAASYTQKRSVPPTKGDRKSIDSGQGGLKNPRGGGAPHGSAAGAPGLGKGEEVSLPKNGFHFPPSSPSSLLRDVWRGTQNQPRQHS